MEYGLRGQYISGSVDEMSLLNETILFKQHVVGIFLWGEGSFLQRCLYGDFDERNWPPEVTANLA